MRRVSPKSVKRFSGQLMRKLQARFIAAARQRVREEKPRGHGDAGSPIPEASIKRAGSRVPMSASLRSYRVPRFHGSAAALKKPFDPSPGARHPRPIVVPDLRPLAELRALIGIRAGVCETSRDRTLR